TCRTLALASSDDQVWRPLGHPSWPSIPMYPSSRHALNLNTNLPLTCINFSWPPFAGSRRWIEDLGRTCTWNGFAALSTISKYYCPSNLPGNYFFPGGSDSPTVDLEKDPDALLKIILVGDLGVGKTSIFRSVANDTFCSTYKATVGVE